MSTTGSAERRAQRAFLEGEGIVRLAPTWVPRTFGRPAGRLRLHPDDHRALGAHRGAIVERWLASTTPADNGPLTPPGEGLSMVVSEDRWGTSLTPLRDAIAASGVEYLGAASWSKDGGWPVLTKFFDYADGLPFHLHQDDARAGLVGRRGKPEAHYFPAQMNPHYGTFPYAFLGLAPGVTEDQVRSRLERLGSGETRITELSLGYRLRTGTAWDVPPGVLHGPGSLCTYEPQRASDVFAMLERVAGADVLPESAVWKDAPTDRHGDVEYLLELIDWEKNPDPTFTAHRFMEPIDLVPVDDQPDAGFVDRWIVYRSGDFSAKELTVRPGREITISDPGAYGLVVIAGHGRIGVHEAAATVSSRFGQLTSDEFFVGYGTATSGVRISNGSRTDDLVLLRHFGHGPEMPGAAGAPVRL